MTNAKNASTAPKPPKKLVPRTAPVRQLPPASTGETAGAPVVAPVAAPSAVTSAPATVAATARVRPARKPSRVDETVARHQKSLAEALEKAQAINYDRPAAAAMKPEAANSKKVIKTEKHAKARKVKLVRDSYAMPEAEYACIAELKKRMLALGGDVKKSELLRAGVAVLAALNDAELKAVMGRVERIKTGRPAK